MWRSLRQDSPSVFDSRCLSAAQSILTRGGVRRGERRLPWQEPESRRPAAGCFLRSARPDEEGKWLTFKPQNILIIRTGVMMWIQRIRRAIQSGLRAILRALTARRPSGASSPKEQILTLGLTISDGFNGQPQALNHQRRPTKLE
jgi:hypothetical protein